MCKGGRGLDRGNCPGRLCRSLERISTAPPQSRPPFPSHPRLVIVPRCSWAAIPPLLTVMGWIHAPPKKNIVLGRVWASFATLSRAHTIIQVPFSSGCIYRVAFSDGQVASEGSTPLHLAALYGRAWDDAEVLELLIDAGADVMAKDDKAQVREQGR